jgi:hypothetical protein
VSDDRKTISVNRARITRPVAAQLDDTDENEPVRPPSVQRVRTPADETLSDLIEGLEGHGVPPEIALALEAIAKRGAEDRRALERQLAAAVSSRSRWSRLLAAAKAIGAGSALAALAVVARALIAHGDAAAMARLQTERIEQLHRSVTQLQIDNVTDRAQAAADHSVLQILAARLSAAPLPP